MEHSQIDETALLELLQALIRIESVNPSLDSGGSGEALIGGYVAERLRGLGLQVDVQHVGERRANIIGTLRGSGSGRCLMLNGHLDTVSAEAMNIEPFCPEFADGKVYGRGSLDMKSGLAAMVAAAEWVLASGITLRGDVVLAFVADEEYASAGTELLVRDRVADAAIICEPTDLSICIAHKGFAWINVAVHGKAAHGSRFDEGVDAIAKAGKFLARLEQHGTGVLSASKHPLLGPPSVHASTISGGIGLSTYPDHCRIQLERRTVPGESPEAVQAEIESLISDLHSEDSQFQADAKVFFSRSPVETSTDEPVLQALTYAYSKVLGKKPAYIGVGGWLDSGILSPAGIPTIAFGPAGSGSHAAVEYVDFASVVATARILSQTIAEFCGS